MYLHIRMYIDIHIHTYMQIYIYIYIYIHTYTYTIYTREDTRGTVSTYAYLIRHVCLPHTRRMPYILSACYTPEDTRGTVSRLSEARVRTLVTQVKKKTLIEP